VSAEFDVRVVPRSSKEEIRVSDGGETKIWVRAAPVDGQANEAVIALLAKRIGVPKSALSVVRGESGRLKRIRIEGIEPSELEKRLSS